MPVAARREELLGLGLELFSTRAYDEVSLEDIAAAAGISKGLVYHYFPSKRDLYVASLRVASDRLLACTEPDPSLPKMAQLMSGLSAYLDYVQGFAKSYTALMKGGIGSDEEATAIVDHSRVVIMERVLFALGIALADAHPALRLIVRGWVGFVEATSIDWLERGTLGRPTVSKEQLLQLMGTALAAFLPTAQAIDPSIRVVGD
jgi:AcrR family transcriptional regulator